MMGTRTEGDRRAAGVFELADGPAQNGAGALYDFGCYGVDLMTWLMHGETPQTVTAVVNHDKPEVYPRWTTMRRSCSLIRMRRR